MALSVDAISNSSQGTTSVSWTHTCAVGAILYIIVHTNSKTNTISAITYNGVTLTQVRLSNTNAYTNVYVLLNPATGANTAAVTLSGGGAPGLVGGAISILGADTTTQPDASNLHTSSGEVSPVVGSVTTVQDDSLVFGAVTTTTASTTINASNTGQTTGYHAHGSQINAVLDYVTTNKTPAGSQSVSIGFSGITANDMVIISVKAATVILRDTSTSGSFTSSASQTVSFTVGANSNRLLLFRFGNHQGGTVSAVQYNGVSLTKLVEQIGSFSENVSIWGLLAPATGTNNLTFTSPSNFTGYAIDSLYNVDQSALPSVTNGASASSTSASVSLTPGSANNWILDVAEAEAGLTVSGGNISDFNQAGQSFENVAGAEDRKTVAAAHTMSWTVSSGQRWNIAAVAIAPNTGTPVTMIKTGSLLLMFR